MPGTPVFSDAALPTGAPVVTGAFEVDGFDSVAKLTPEGEALIKEQAGPVMPPGDDGSPGEQGIPGPPGPPGIGLQGPQGVPGEQGVDGSDGPPGLPGTPGATGEQGQAGVPGPPGEPGEQGEQGPPGIQGQQGEPGGQGQAGVPGPPGDQGEQGSDGFPGLPGPQGARGLQGDRGMPGDDGIAGESAIIVAQTSSDINVGLFNPGSQLGRPIDEVGAGTPVKLTPAQQGENWRWSTGNTDTTTSGDLGATSYVIEEPDNTRQWTAPSPIIIHGMSFPGVGGGTAVAADGRPVMLRLRGGSSPILFRHESSTEATTTRRLQMPGSGDWLALPRDMAIAWDDPIGNRRMILPFAQIRDSSVCEIRDDFTGGVNTNGAIGETGWRGDTTPPSPHSPGSESNHPGIWRVGPTAASNGAAAYLTRVNPSGTIGGQTGEGTHFPQEVDLIEMIVRPNATFGVANCRIFCGLSQDSRAVNHNTVECVGAAFDTGTADSGWMLQTRSAGASSRNGSGVSVSAGTWYRILLIRYPSGWALKVNNSGNLVLNTTNIPTTLMHPVFSVTTLEAVSKQLEVDFFRLVSTGLSRF